MLDSLVFGGILVDSSCFAHSLGFKGILLFSEMSRGIFLIIFRCLGHFGHL